MNRKNVILIAIALFFLFLSGLAQMASGIAGLMEP
jgi:hypothetical protein